MPYFETNSSEGFVIFGPNVPKDLFTFFGGN
jgi:hypothetical protein